MKKPSTPEKVSRGHVLAHYCENQLDFMQSIFPQAPKNELRNFIRGHVETKSKELKQRLRDAVANGEDIVEPRSREELLWPTLRMIRQTDDRHGHRYSHGNLEYYEHEDLLSVLLEYQDKVIAPYGTIYQTSDIHSGFLKGMIGALKTQRSAEKKLMQKAKQRGDAQAAMAHNNGQATLKIVANSSIGAQGSNSSFLSSVSNFTSVTAIARFFTMNAYAYAERFLESNFYFRTEDQVLDFLVCCRKFGPPSEIVNELIVTNNFHIPSSDDIYDFLIHHLHRYSFDSDHPAIRNYINTLTAGERCFVFYMSNMKNLAFSNEEYFREWFEAFIDIEDVFELPEDMSLDALFKIDEDLIAVLGVLYGSLLPVNEKGVPISVYDSVKVAPEVAKKIIMKSLQMQELIEQIFPVFEIFMNHKVNISYVAEHKNMYREAIIYSDTDSIAFTTKTWVQWLTGSLKLSDKAMAMNATMVYLLSKAIVYLLANISASTGATGDDVHAMSMKNEYYMLITILTALKKNYIQLLKVQEGIVFTKPKLDIKGVNLRGSNYSREVLNYTEWYIRNTIDEIIKNGTVSAREKILEIMRFERMILDSLMDKKTEFLMVQPIKSASEYSDADKSIHFNYLFWEEVFGDKYGNIAIPTKCYMLPVTGIRSKQFHAFLEERFPDRVPHLDKFLKKHDTKDINRIPINPISNEIPEELQNVANYRDIIYNNTRPLYLVATSLGITIGSNKKQNTLFSDVYGMLPKEEGLKARTHL